MTVSSEGERNKSDQVSVIADLAGLVERFRIRAHRHARGHYLASKKNSAMHSRLGIPAVALSTGVGSSIFATISASPNLWLVVIAGLASISAALLGALQTFFGFSGRASEHRRSGAEFAALKRDLDVYSIKLKAHSLVDLDRTMSEVAAITDRFNQMQRDSPDIPDHFYDQARREQITDLEGV